MHLKSLTLFCWFYVQIVVAQQGFNQGYEYNYFINYFNDVVVKNDTIVAYGLAQDTAWPYKQGIFIARFDSLGAPLDNKIVVDSGNNLFSFDKSWGKIIATKDGGFAMTAISNFGGDGVFIKLNHKLELEFTQYYIDTVNLAEFLIAPIEIPDGFLLYGYYQKAGNGKWDALLRKVDKSGVPIWRKNFGVTVWNESFNKAERFQDSLWVLSGSKIYDALAPGTGLPWVCIFNDQGDLKWEWSANSINDFNGIQIGWFYPRLDGSWLGYGGKYLGKDPIYGLNRFQSYWVKLDSAFQFQWSKPFGPNVPLSPVFYQIVRAINGDLIGIGERGPFDFDPETYYRKGWVMRFSPEADSLWEWTGKMPVANPEAHYFSGGALLSSGSVVAAGGGDNANGHTLCWVVKLSPDGCVDTLFCHPTSALQAPTHRHGALEIFPNPAWQNVEVSLGQETLPKEARIFLRDLSGRVLREYSMQNTRQTLSLAGIPVGIYWLELISEHGAALAWKKLVIAR